MFDFIEHNFRCIIRNCYPLRAVRFRCMSVKDVSRQLTLTSPLFSVVNKDLGLKDKAKAKDMIGKDKDKDKDMIGKDKDKDKDLTDKDKGKDKDFNNKDKNKDWSSNTTT